MKMSDKSRRKLLKSLAAGSGAIVAGKSLPENWTKPVVDSVMLPAHAQTSAPLLVLPSRYVTPGTYEGRVPEGVTSLTVAMSAGGGGGGGSFAGTGGTGGEVRVVDSPQLEP
jgi:hypothetical protein